MDRIISFDFFKVTAIVSVIMIHSGMFMHNSNVGLIINSLGRFAVPFFLMIAGYLFTLKYQEKSYFKKYILRLVKTYLIASSIYILFNALIDFLSKKNVLDELLKRLNPLGLIYYGDSISEHLWFLPALIFSIAILYLSLKYNILGKILIISLILNIAGLFGEGQLYSQFFNLPIKTRETLFFALFYTLFGAYAHNFKVNKSSNYYLVLLISFTLLHLSERIFFVKISGANLDSDYNVSLIPMLYFLFKLSISSRDFNFPKIITNISSSVLWIYVSHFIFIILGFTVLAILNLFKVIPTIWWNLIFSPIVFFCSYLTHRIYIKIKK